MGEAFGHGLFAHEINWAISNEWVYGAADFLWRRSKMGLRMSKEEVAALDNYIKAKNNTKCRITRNKPMTSA